MLRGLLRRDLSIRGQYESSEPFGVVGIVIQIHVIGATHVPNRERQLLIRRHNLTARNREHAQRHAVLFARVGIKTEILAQHEVPVH